MDNEPISREEALKFVKEFFGEAFVKPISRNKYSATVLIKDIHGEREVVVSLPLRLS